MVIEKLQHKEIRPCNDYQLRVLFLDPKPIYDRIKVNHFERIQSVPIGDMFPVNGNVCGCGCGAELTGRKRRWATDGCKHFAQAVWGIINGHSEIISSYLRLYNSVEACVDCGLTDAYTEYKNGMCVNAIHKDHITPVCKGGGGCWLSNYQYLCDTCHKTKTKTDLKKNKMNLKPTQESLNKVARIATILPTFHHHYHILFDIAETFGDKKINYLEIGAYAGGSSCLMLQRPNTTIVSIDLGEPIPKADVLENVIIYKNNDNYYKYIQGNSQVIETKNQVIEVLSNSRALGHSNKIELLFIDGDHSLNGVLADFNMYSDLVAVGGYIVFDDYRDDIYSPDVKKALDEIILPNLVDYEIIGTFENTLGAYPKELTDGNCFVIKKIR